MGGRKAQLAKCSRGVHSLVTCLADLVTCNEVPKKGPFSQSTSHPDASISHHPILDNQDVAHRPFVRKPT